MELKEAFQIKLKEFWPENAPDSSNVQKYINKYKKDKIVIKCGGKVLIDLSLFNNFIEDLTILYKLGLNIIVVHGGGPRIKIELEKLNLESKFINGLRVTDKQTMEVVEKSLVEFNNEIVEKLRNKNCQAQGLNVSNNNADAAASALAKSIKSRRLLLMTDVEGVLDENKKLINEIKPNQAKELIEKNIVQGGMIPKLLNSINAVESGVKGVVIIDGRKVHSILYEIFSDEGAGTLIRK